jgi:hypothetical protein
VEINHITINDVSSIIVAMSVVRGLVVDHAHALLVSVSWGKLWHNVGPLNQN